jgi:hypothetical protein
MPTIAELLAAKAKASKPAAPATTPGAAAPAAKKPLPFPTLAKLPVEPVGEILPRSLSTTSGEDVPQTPYSASPQEVVWHSALQGLNTELCVIQDPDPRNERAWMAIRRHDDPTRPIYLFSLPSFPALGPQPEPF